MAVKTALIDTGPRPFCLQCSTPWGGLCDAANAISRGNRINDILIDTRIQLRVGDWEILDVDWPRYLWSLAIRDFDCVPLAANPEYTTSAASVSIRGYSIVWPLPIVTIPESLKDLWYLYWKPIWTYDNFCNPCVDYLWFDFIMDPRQLYTDFLMDGEEVLLQPMTDAEPTFKDDRGYTYCALAVFRSDDPDLARDPLSTNRRPQVTADLEMFGTMSVAGPMLEQIFVLIPDSCVDADSPADLQHVVGLSLGSAENLSSTLPTEGLHLALCDKSLRPTLSLRCNDYWSEVSPIIRTWQSVNDASCPHCHQIIRVNMPIQSASVSGGVRCPAALHVCGFLQN